MPKPVIECEDLHFTYEGASQAILNGVHLEIREGQFAVIAGPSGAGKSTLCRTFNNIVPLFYKGDLSGIRRIVGQPIDSQKTSSLARVVGMVFQDFEHQLFSTSSLLELSFGLENFGVPAAEMRKRMEELLERFGLTSLARREPFSLSGGEKQKLAIASVMAYRPEILVLDEPTTDLDPENKELVLETLPLLKDWVGTTVIVDHETDRFQKADQILLLREGVIQAAGRASEILTQPDLLIRNSMAVPELISLQNALGLPQEILSVEEISLRFGDKSFRPIPLVSRTSGPGVMEVEHLSFRYAPRSEPALKNVSFQIHQGEFVGIIGHNGSGKSTLLRHLNGLQHPQQGSVRILGKETKVWDRKDLSRTVGLVFQNPDHQIFHATVRDEVEFGPLRFHFSNEERKESVDHALRTMDLESVSDRDPFQLSKGERQRVAVASVLSTNPEILILDEPTTGLDHRQQIYLMNLLRERNRQGTTIIIVTHSLKLVGEYCNHVLLLKGGALFSEGHPREIFFQASQPMKLPPLWELSRKLGGNALTVEEFTESLT